MGTQQHADGGYRQKIKQKFNQEYSPEPRDIYFTVPNLISVLRIASIPFIAWLVADPRMVPTLIVLAVSAITDSLDGIIARAFNQVSKIGQILDPIADRLLIICSVLALGVAGIIPWWMIIIIAARDAWMMLLVLWLAQYDYGPLPVHFVGKAGTFMLMVSIVADFLRHLGEPLRRASAPRRAGRRHLGRRTVLARRLHLQQARHFTAGERETCRWTLIRSSRCRFPCRPRTRR